MIEGFLSGFSWLIGLVAGIWGLCAWVMAVLTIVLHPKVPIRTTLALSGAATIALYFLDVEHEVVKLLFYTCLTIFSGSFVLLAAAYWRHNG